MPRRHLRIKRERFRPAPRRHVVEIRNPPTIRLARRRLARAHPHRVRAHAHLVATGLRRLEALEPQLDRFIRARDYAHGLELAGGRIGGAHGDRLFGRAHVRLRLGPEDRKRRPLRPGVEHGVDHPPRKRTLLARVVAGHLRVRPLDLMRQHLPQRFVRDREVAGEIHMREIERVANLVETVRLAVLRQAVADLQPGRPEQISHGVFVFKTIQAPLRRPPLSRFHGPFGRHQRAGHRAHEGFDLTRGGPRLLFRWHLAGPDAVMHLHPGREILRIFRPQRERRQIETAFLFDVVVAARAVRFDEHLRGRRHRRGPAART